LGVANGVEEPTPQHASDTETPVIKKTCQRMDESFLDGAFVTWFGGMAPGNAGEKVRIKPKSGIRLAELVHRVVKARRAACCSGRRRKLLLLGQQVPAPKVSGWQVACGQASKWVSE